MVESRDSYFGVKLGLDFYIRVNRHQAALTAGIDFTQGDVIISMDGDGQQVGMTWQTVAISQIEKVHKKGNTDDANMEKCPLPEMVQASVKRIWCKESCMYERFEACLL